MDLDSPSKEVEHRNAPWFNVPRVPVIGIEHPYLISDIGKAIQTLGGSELSSKVLPIFLDHRTEISLSLARRRRISLNRSKSLPAPGES